MARADETKEIEKIKALIEKAGIDIDAPDREVLANGEVSTNDPLVPSMRYCSQGRSVTQIYMCTPEMEKSMLDHGLEPKHLWLAEKEWLCTHSIPRRGGEI